MNRVTAKETIERLDKILTWLGYPRTLTFDNGKQLVSDGFRQFCHMKGLVLNQTIPYWPQKNGEVEPVLVKM